MISFIRYKSVLRGMRNNNLLNNVLGSIVIKGLAIVISILLIPAYMQYFSDQSVLGVWLTLIATLTWIISFDLGIGNGLRNKLVEALTIGDHAKAKRYISSSYIIIGALTLSLSLIGYISLSFINWNSALGISSDVVRPPILLASIRVIFIGIMLQFFLKLIFSILNAMHRTAMTNLITLISSSSLLLFLLFFRGSTTEQNLYILSLVNMILTNLPLLIATLIVFLTLLKRSRPNYKYFINEYASEVMKLGGAFFWIQVSFMLITSTNEFIITWFYDVSYVVEYQVYFRVFYFSVTVFSLITNPVWSAITKAHTEMRLMWIKKIGSILNIVALMASAMCLLIVFFMQDIVDLWLGEHSIVVSARDSILFLLNSSVMMFVLAATCLANGMGRLKVQLICYSIVAILKVPLVFIIDLVFHHDWTSVIIANTVLLIPCVVIQMYSNNKYLKTSKI